MAVTSGADIRHAVHAIIDADLTLQETRDAVMSLIPEEYHVEPYGPQIAPDGAATMTVGARCNEYRPGHPGRMQLARSQGSKPRHNGRMNHVLMSAGTDKPGEC